MSTITNLAGMAIAGAAVAAIPMGFATHALGEANHESDRPIHGPELGAAISAGGWGVGATLVGLGGGLGLHRSGLELRSSPGLAMFGVGAAVGTLAGGLIGAALVND